MTNLLIPKNEAEEKLIAQIKQGNDILNIQINNEEKLESTQLEYRKWSSFNAELIKKIFDTKELLDEYNYYYGGVMIPKNSLQPRIKRFHENVKDKIGKLEIIKGKLSFFEKLKSEKKKENSMNLIIENKVINIAEKLLRKSIRTIPSSEKNIQDAFDSLLIGAEINYSREIASIEYSSKTYKPDFIIRDIQLAVEIKFCNRKEREKELIAEINDDIMAYQKSYKKILFVIYDLGIIRDIDKFSNEFIVNQNIIMKVVKN